MIKTQKLKGKIVENGYTTKVLSEKMGICYLTLKRKIEGSQQFKLNELCELKNILKLTNEECKEIFLGGQDESE